MADLDPISLNVSGVRELVGSKVNKVGAAAPGSEEGAGETVVDVLELPMTDEELLAMKDQWEIKYATYKSTIEERQNANKTYYIGRELEGAGVNREFPIAANLLFEAEETFLPAALSRNPEPVVWADNTTDGTKAAQDLKTMLQFHADTLVLRRKLMLMTRHWSIYFIGVMKHGWDTDINDIKTEVRKPKHFVFDPDGFVDVYGDMHGYVGERITVSADELIDLFPKHKDTISASVKGQLGTPVTYTEWWTDEFCFYTYTDTVLDKHKNPHFLYANQEKDQDGVDTEILQQNHFAHPKKPYTFLSVFSLEEQPHDVTGLLEQNIPNQNLITKRTMQIDANLSRQNNSVAFSGDNFNQQTAKQASTAFEKGNPVLVPSGRPIAEAIVRFPAEAYPEAAFRELEENKQNLRSSFGTQGITSQQQDEKTTARGMILNQQRDTTRIGGGIGDALEQVADNIFNWWVQLYHVYYDEPHYAAIMGSAKAVEYTVISSEKFKRNYVISVAPGSMRPKDEVTEMNQAMQLYEAGVLDPKTLLTILDVPDVQKTTENTILWLLDKTSYLKLNFPELAAQLMQLQAGVPSQMAGGQAPEPSAPTPEAPSSPAPSLGGEPPNAALSQVQLPA